MDMKSALTLAAPVLKLVWEQAAHPALKGLEGKINQQDLKLVVETLDAALDEIIKAELGKI